MKSNLKKIKNLIILFDNRNVFLRKDKIRSVAIYVYIDKILNTRSFDA